MRSGKLVLAHAYIHILYNRPFSPTRASPPPLFHPPHPLPSTQSNTQKKNPSLAVGANKAPLVHYLLSKGASPNANLRGETYSALELASVVNADLEMTTHLISHGSIIQGRSALLFAARAGRVDVLEKLLASSGNADVMNALPSNDVYDNARERRDWGTPLHGAVGKNQVAVVRWLLGKGADPAVRNHVGLTPKELADEKGYEECSDLLSYGGEGV